MGIAEGQLIDRHKGGVVKKKVEFAKLHKGEKVLTKKQRRKPSLHQSMTKHMGKIEEGMEDE